VNVKASSVAAAVLACIASAPAFAVDWASVPGKDIPLFYPGQSPFEFVMTEDHEGSKKFKEGKDCFACHSDEMQKVADKLVSGKVNGPAVPGKPGLLPVTVKVANDGKNLLVHLDFKTAGQPDLKEGKDDTVVTMMLFDDSDNLLKRMGCFATCHVDSTGMPGAKGEKTKYLPKAAVKLSAQGGDIKPAADLAALAAAGYSAEYWQAKLNPGAKAVAASGTIVGARTEIAASKVEVDGTIGSVTLSRPLVAGAPYKDIVAGKTYTVGFAVHTGHSKGRMHYVSFATTLGLDGTADLVAAKK